MVVHMKKKTNKAQTLANKTWHSDKQDKDKSHVIKLTCLVTHKRRSGWI